MNVEVIRGWEMARELLQEAWEELYRQADMRSPFTSFQWFDTWFQVFGDPETVRIVVVRDDNRVRAILPGRIEKHRYGGLPLTCFVFPADAHTPRSGVVCLPGNVDAARAAIMATMTLDEPVDLAILPDIELHSVNWQVLSGGLPAPCSVRVEHRYQSPFFSMEDGWEAYLRGRSVNFRKSIRQSIKRCEGRGQVTSEVFVVGQNFQAGLDRLRALDERTWQGKNGSGVFRSRNWGRFYDKLSRTSLPLVRFELEFLLIDGVDVAFALLASQGEQAFLLRTGYDTDYENYHPGVTLQERFCKRLVAAGVTNFDFGAFITEYKKRWETGRHEHACYWVINRGTLKGRLLWLELLLHDRIRPRLERWRSAKAAGPQGAEA